MATDCENGAPGVAFETAVPSSHVSAHEIRFGLLPGLTEIVSVTMMRGGLGGGDGDNGLGDGDGDGEGDVGAGGGGDGG
jgi:hypothetical protein